jgi:O-antigen/teichoic acid export membrane protein
MSRVSFPLYSRLQTDRAAFARAVERAVVVSAMGTLFFVGLGLGIGPALVGVVYGQKWIPALPLFYVYAVGISVGFLHPVIAPAFDALGKPQVNVKLMIGWTAAICALVALTTPRWGALGFAVGYCIPMVLGNVVVVYVLKQLVPSVKLWPRIGALLAGAAAVAIAGRLAVPWIGGVLSLVVAVVASAALFVGIVRVLSRSAIDEVLELIGRRTS